MEKELIETQTTYPDLRHETNHLAAWRFINSVSNFYMFDSHRDGGGSHQNGSCGWKDKRPLTLLPSEVGEAKSKLSRM
jgi:hypothetical protein